MLKAFRAVVRTLPSEARESGKSAEIPVGIEDCSEDSPGATCVARGGIVVLMDDDPRSRAHRGTDERSAETQAQPDSATLRSLMASRLEGFRRFNAWEKRERTYLPFEVALRSVDDLRKLVSEETWDRDPDPERAGVRRMHEVLDCLSHSTRRRTGGPR